MRHLSQAATLSALCLFASAMVGSVSAHGYKIGELDIEHPWARATPAGAPVAGGYMKITNKGTTPDRLIGGTAVPAGGFEIHEMKMDGEVMKMRMLANGLEILPGQTVELKPGSYHVMFTKLNAGFPVGEKVKGTLVFEKAGTVEVEFNVEPIGAATSGPGAHGAADHKAGDQEAGDQKAGDQKAGDHAKTQRYGGSGSMRMGGLHGFVLTWLPLLVANMG